MLEFRCFFRCQCQFFSLRQNFSHFRACLQTVNNAISIVGLFYSKPFCNTLNYASTVNIQDAMKFYNSGDQNLETDFSIPFSVHAKVQIGPFLIGVGIHQSLLSHRVVYNGGFQILNCCYSFRIQPV